MGIFEKIRRGIAGGHHSGARSGRDGGYGNTGPYPASYSPQAGPQPGLVCAGCGSANVRSARFCQQCGATLAAGKCGGCGIELAAGARFCPQCGKPRA